VFAAGSAQRTGNDRQRINAKRGSIELLGLSFSQKSDLEVDAGRMNATRRNVNAAAAHRIRMGLTGLATVFLLVMFAAAGMRPTPTAAAAVAPPAESLAVLGVAPGAGPATIAPISIASTSIASTPIASASILPKPIALAPIAPAAESSNP
jgi:hypothetical protein